MTLVHPLPSPLVDRIAQRFRVLGEPMRIRLLDRLRDGEASVQDLTDALGTTQQNVSKHLGVLHAEAVVTRRREGARVLYTIADESVFEICETVCGGLRRQVSELDELLAGASR
jgi:DNA-binding transcriptional ArsR family regulator